ncbi:MAG: hypothetical protein RLZZ630_741 [Bacteroidota bacterium]|jgi:uncharacterized membrane protein YjgN (DUF898 family)
MTWRDIPQVLFEILWPFIFIFSFVVLVKARIRRIRSKRSIEFKSPRWLFVVAALLSLGFFLLAGTFIMDPVTTEMLVTEKLNKEESQVFFLAGMVVFLVILPQLVTSLACRYWPVVEKSGQRNSE